MAVSRTRRAGALLDQQAQGNYGFGKTVAVAPDAAMYGIFGPQYAAALAAGANNEAGGATQSIFDRASLRNGANAENQRYADELARSRVAQEELQRNDARYQFTKDVGTRYLDAMDRGVAGVEHVGTDANGDPTIITDPVREMVGNEIQQDAAMGDTFGKKAHAVGELGAAGYGFTPGQVGRMLRAPTNPNPLPMQPYMTPHDASTDFHVHHNENEGLTAEQQMEIARIQAAAKDKGLVATVGLDPATGERVWSVKGEPNAVQQFYTDNPNVKAPTIGMAPPDPDGNGNPTADARGGRPSATPAAPTGFYAAIGSHKGMRTDPFTGKPRMHKGDDIPKPLNTPFPAEADGNVVHVGPIRGFGSNAVVVQYDNGQQVLYGHGNAANVKVGQRVKAGDVLGLVGSQGRSTGPHVHRQVIASVAPIGQPNATQGSQGAPSARANIMAKFKSHGYQVAMNGSNIVVTNPQTGAHAVYDPSGNRIRE